MQKLKSAHQRAIVYTTAALLDKVEPDWHMRVEPETLNICDSKLCVLGQLYGDFFTTDLSDLGYTRSHALKCPWFFGKLRAKAEKASRLAWAYKSGLGYYQDHPSRSEIRKETKELNDYWEDQIRSRKYSLMPAA